jgi:hypothetical protein
MLSTTIVVWDYNELSGSDLWTSAGMPDLGCCCSAQYELLMFHAFRSSSDLSNSCASNTFYIVNASVCFHSGLITAATFRAQTAL